jgi:hypothetical protein
MRKIYWYDQKKPILTVEDYFNGDIKGWGFIQGVIGRVMNCFKIDMKCQWAGGHGIIDEQFVFDDGEIVHRTWQLTRVDEGHFIGVDRANNPLINGAGR